MKFLVVVVNYNQALEIKFFLESLEEHWPRLDTVVVDDGSTDLSAKVAEELGYSVIHHKKNMGVGAAIRTGYLYAKDRGYSHVVIMSSNGKMLPSEIKKIISPIEKNEADYVTGSRYLKGGSMPGLTIFRKVSIPLLSIFFGLILKHKITDITCGFRSYSVEFVLNPPLDVRQSWLNEYEMEYYVHYWACKNKLRIKEIPVMIRYNHLAKSRVSKIKPFTGWWSMFRPIILLTTGLKK